MPHLKGLGSLIGKASSDIAILPRINQLQEHPSAGHYSPVPLYGGDLLYLTG
jgi:hypothetical protein